MPDYSTAEITEMKVRATGILPKLIMDNGNHLNQNPKNGNWSGACPECGGEDRFAIFLNQNRKSQTGDFFNCRGCNWKGDIITWYMEGPSQTSFPDALVLIEGGHKRYGADTTTYTGDIAAAPADAPAAVAAAPAVVTPTPEKLDPVMLTKHLENFRFNLLVADEHPEWQLYQNGSAARNFSPMEYLEYRGLSVSTVKKFKLGFNPDWLDIEGTKLAPGITIPLYYTDPATSQNDIIGFNVRLYDHSFIEKGTKYMRRGTGPYLLNKDSLDVHKIAVVVEGELDAFLLDQYLGDRYAVVTYGSVTGTSQVSPEDMASHFMNQKKVYWCLDGDAAGTTAIESIMNANVGTNGERFERLGLPEGIDITEFLMDKGEKEFDNFFATRLLQPPFPWD